MESDFFDMDPKRQSVNAKRYNPDLIKEGRISMWIADTDLSELQQNY